MFGNRSFLFSREKHTIDAVQSVCPNAVISKCSCSLEMTMHSISPPGPPETDLPHIDIKILAKNNNDLDSWIISLSEFSQGPLQLQVDGRKIEIRPINGHNSNLSAEHWYDLFVTAKKNGHLFEGRTDPIEIRCYFDD